MDKKAKKKHLKELKRKKVQRNIRLFGKQISHETQRDSLTFDEIVKILQYK